MGGIFKAYDIRGSYPDELDETVAKKIGNAFVRLIDARRLVVARDMRSSASALAEAFIEGAVSSGCALTDIGMATTPLLYYAIIEGRFDGGCMVTASHLPGRMNGFKLCRHDAIPLSGDQGLPELERLVAAKPASRQHPTVNGSRQDLDVSENYIERLGTYVHNPRPLKIVVDAANGMAGPEVFDFFERFPVWTLVPMYMEPDGSFPHHVANPLLPSATRDLQAMVVREHADIGVAFDGDADRCGLIDEKGQRIPEDLVTALIAEFLLTKEPGATILYDLRSSHIVPETITRLGGKARRCRVGHAFIKAVMREVNALFAGELSGHYYYRDMGFTDNGIFTMIQMLNLLSLKNAPLSQMVGPLRKYYATGEINIRVSDNQAIFAALEGRYDDAGKDHLDGLSIEYDTWWFNLRTSNTEPLLRLNLEANDQTTRGKRCKEVLAVVRAADPTMKVVE
jgi:phosphomannomutase